MAVKASATITLTSYRDTQSVTRYYKLQTAGSSAPSKPTTKPPSSDWTDSEPACDISKELYFCDLTIFSNGEWEYSKVSKSSSYEAAKEAYNKANNAQSSIDNLEIGGRNLFANSRQTTNTLYSDSEYNSIELTGWGKSQQLVTNVDWNAHTINELILSMYLKPTSIDGDGSVCAGFQVFYIDGTFTQYLGGVNWANNNEGYVVGEEGYCKLKCAIPEGKTIDYIIVAVRNSISTQTAVVEYREIKLEAGNKATDWTPAPEDVDAGISEAQSNALTAQEEASALDTDLSDFKSNEYSQINDKVGELVEYKGENEKEIGKIREELSQELVAQKFARIEPDNGSLILGEIDGTTAVLTNEQFGFYTPNSEIAAAYFGKDNDAWAFNIDRGIIKNDLRFGGFQWIARSNKNMSLKWLK